MMLSYSFVLYLFYYFRTFRKSRAESQFRDKILFQIFLVPEGNKNPFGDVINFCYTIECTIMHYYIWRSRTKLVSASPRLGSILSCLFKIQKELSEIDAASKKFAQCRCIQGQTAALCLNAKLCAFILRKIPKHRSASLEKTPCCFFRVSEVSRKNKKGGCYHPR